MRLRDTRGMRPCQHNQVINCVVFPSRGPTIPDMSFLRFSRLLLTLLISGACASAYELSPNYDDGLANPSPSLPGQLGNSSLPGQIVKSLPGQIVPLLPNQIVQPLSGQVVRSLPGQIVRPLYGQIKRPVLPWAMHLGQPIVAEKPKTAKY